MQKLFRFLVIVIVIACFGGALAYQLPPVKERINWRVEKLRADMKYALNPPQKMVFVPEKSPTADVGATLQALAQLMPTPSPTPGPIDPPPITATPSPTPTMAPSPTPIPEKALLAGIKHEYQMWNNCGPANLAMALSFWGWQGDQRSPAAFVKPNARDKNVMPWELQAYVQAETAYRSLIRVGGDLELVKAFVAAGFPVLIEKGFEGPGFDGWMGHYQVINGYHDPSRRFTVQDSYKGANITLPYEDVLRNWRAFNYIYLIIYPPERELEVYAILGPQADEGANYQHAAQLALAETAALSGRDLFFAWFNRGTNLVYLKDYAGAATAYDAAFAHYPSIPENERPWRMMWYQTGPYFAYYYSQRYQDVINLATTTLEAASEKVLEESFYWRGRAKLALGDNDGAIQDFRLSLKAHPDFQPALEQLQFLGIQP